MKENYCKSSAHVVVWDNTVLEMMKKKVRPKNGLFWGKPQVVQLKWKCTGTPTSVKKHDYLTEYKVKDRQGEWHVQCNCIVLITVNKAEDQAKVELEVKSGYVDLFGIDSSQSQDNPLSPLPRRRKRCLEERHKVDNKDNNSCDYDGGRGTRGRGYGGKAGGGKHGY
jgi:hypothetical protein